MDGESRDRIGVFLETGVWSLTSLYMHVAPYSQADDERLCNVGNAWWGVMHNEKGARSSHTLLSNEVDQLFLSFGQSHSVHVL